MAATTERPAPRDRLLTEPLTQGEPGKWTGEFAVPPDMGRTVHIVGPVINVKPSDTPHPRNARGELGPVMMSHYRNRMSADPLGRVTGGANHAADRRNVPTDALNRSPKGDINPDRLQVDDPEAMSRHIKRVALYYAAELSLAVSVAVVDQEGAPIAVARMNGAAPWTPEIAFNKAHTAASFWVATHLMRAEARRPWFQSLVMSSHGRIMQAGGGVPIVEHAYVIGAVGVAGTDSEEQDLRCCQAALAVVTSHAH